MNRLANATVACEVCGHEQKSVIWNSVNVTFDPELKRKLISGELTTFTCRKCGWSGPVRYPILYHDMDKHLMIYLPLNEAAPKVEDVPMEAWLEGINEMAFLRIVRSRSDLIEKVLVFDAGLDDRLMAMFKLLLAKKLTQDALPVEELFFNKMDEEDGERVLSFSVLLEGKPAMISVSYESYRRFSAKCETLLPDATSESGQWLRVDSDYITTLDWDRIIGRPAQLAEAHG